MLLGESPVTRKKQPRLPFEKTFHAAMLFADKKGDQLFLVFEK
jgi:hypothetical protein